MWSAIPDGTLKVLGHNGHLKSRFLWTGEDSCWEQVMVCYVGKRLCPYLCECGWAPEIAGTYKTPVVLGAGGEMLQKTCSVREVPAASFTAHIPDGFLVIVIAIITLRVVGGGFPVSVERGILQVLATKRLAISTPHI
jgi:hypothetical protein